jgi:predicted deacetylase
MVVSLHDVAPFQPANRKHDHFRARHRGVRVCSLLVVPGLSSSGAFTKDQQFVSWLRGLEADGHEIVIHGYFQ